MVCPSGWTFSFLRTALSFLNLLWWKNRWQCFFPLVTIYLHCKNFTLCYSREQNAGVICWNTVTALVRQPPFPESVLPCWEVEIHQELLEDQQSLQQENSIHMSLAQTQSQTSLQLWPDPSVEPPMSKESFHVGGLPLDARPRGSSWQSRGIYSMSHTFSTPPWCSLSSLFPP